MIVRAGWETLGFYCELLGLHSPERTIRECIVDELLQAEDIFLISRRDTLEILRTLRHCSTSHYIVRLPAY
jgi:hypothetical protein